MNQINTPNGEVYDDPGRKITLDHGYILYRYGPGRTCEIVDIEVESAHRGKGVGRKLLERLFKEIDGKADSVYAVTRMDNEVAQEFYEHTLFRVVGVLRRFYSTQKYGADAIMYGRLRKGPV